MKMPSLLLVIAAVVLFIHGLIHLLGLVAYWPLADLAELPYKTVLAGGRIELSAQGMRVYSVLWALAAIGFVAAAITLLVRSDVWLPVVSMSLVLSLLIVALDWNVAFRGALVNFAILIPVIVALGLRMQPSELPPAPGKTSVSSTAPVPDDLPQPVERYYRTTIGDEYPLIDSAIITMRGDVRVMGITFPSRLRFTHRAGRAYRHYIEVTLFDKPIMKINEWYLEGKARLELPFGVTENEPKVDSAANLGLWGESVWLPSVYLSDPDAHWEPVDANTARLIVPAADGKAHFTVRFDSDTGLLTSMEALRYKDAAAGEKTPWRFDVLAWREFEGMRLPSRGAVTWLDEGSPWLTVELDDVKYNVDVATYIRQSGP